MRETDNRTPEEIESDIARTRADFSSTIDAIQHKLSPGEIMDQAVDYALSKPSVAFGANLINTVRANPIPIALIGVGAAWLMMARREPADIHSRARYARSASTIYYPEAEAGYIGDDAYLSSSSSDDSRDGMMQRARARTTETARGLKQKAGEVGQRVSSSASLMGERVQQAGQTARSRLTETASTAQERMSEMGRRSQEQLYRAKERVGGLMDEQPLVIGALGIALGAALGALIPTTRRENELMGGMRDELVGRAKETAMEQAENMKQTAQRVAEVAMQEAERVKDDLAGAMQSSPASSRDPGGTQVGGISGQQSIH